MAELTYVVEWFRPPEPYEAVHVIAPAPPGHTYVPGVDLRVSSDEAARLLAAAERLRRSVAEAAALTDAAEGRRRGLLAHRGALQRAREEAAARLARAVGDYAPVHAAIRSRLLRAASAVPSWHVRYGDGVVHVHRTLVPPHQSVPLDDVLREIRLNLERTWIERFEVAENARAEFEAAVGEPVGVWWPRARRDARSAYLRHAAREGTDWDYEADGSTLRVFRWHQVDPDVAHAPGRPSGRSLTVEGLVTTVSRIADRYERIEVAPAAGAAFGRAIGAPVGSWWPDARREAARRRAVEEEARRRRRESRSNYPGAPSGGYSGPPI